MAALRLFRDFCSSVCLTLCRPCRCSPPIDEEFGGRGRLGLTGQKNHSRSQDSGKIDDCDLEGRGRDRLPKAAGIKWRGPLAGDKDLLGKFLHWGISEPKP